MADDDEHPPFWRRRNDNDVNSRIMLTAIISLSFVILLVTIFHIYARCILRRQSRRRNAIRQLGFITAVVQANEPPKTGLDPAVLAAMPVFVFKQADDTEIPSNSMECSVCLSLLEDGEMARTLPNCQHTFHANCIDEWFGSNSTCPICRTGAEPKLVPEPREGVVAATGATPSAPPIEGTSDGGGVQLSAKVGRSSSSRLSSFRKMITRERSSSSRRIQINQSCINGQDHDGLPDLERQ